MMSIDEQKELIELTKKLLAKANLCTHAPHYITSFIKPVADHHAIITKLNLFDTPTPRG